MPGKLKQIYRELTAKDPRRMNVDHPQRFALRAADSKQRRLKAIYRISDGSYKKERFAFATIEACLRNFVGVFNMPVADLKIIADNVGDETFAMVNRLHSNVVRTNFGNGADSWRHAAFDIALNEFNDEDAVYFVEDDYLHVPGAKQSLVEGISIADYVSLYDNSDKYINAADGGPNHFIEYGGEMTRVVRTPSTHWKLTNSTTMTFAVTVGTLREDREVWGKFTKGGHPRDFEAFLTLGESGRSVITPIPSVSTHCEYEWAAPGIDWKAIADIYSNRT